MVHTKPTDAVKEIDALTDVAVAAAAHYGHDRVLLMGDFNADCSYVPRSAWDKISLWIQSLWTEAAYHWLIPTGIDTTVTSTVCTYDRFVSSAALHPHLVHEGAGPFRFDAHFNLSRADAELVSDHYPITVDLLCPILPPPSSSSTGGPGPDPSPSIAPSLHPLSGISATLLSTVALGLALASP